MDLLPANSASFVWKKMGSWFDPSCWTGSHLGTLLGDHETVTLEEQRGTPGVASVRAVDVARILALIFGFPDAPLAGVEW